MYQLNGKTTDNLLKEAYSLAENPNKRDLDMLLSVGEQITISKLSILLNTLGYDTISLTGWQAGINTTNVHQLACINTINISRIEKELLSNKIVIVAGFQGINDNFDITTLGRGGSDTTAVALAAALNAKCYIYSDVAGIYSADPNKIQNAKKIDSLSYTEMLNLSNEGAKVLHNRCIEIGKNFNIPIIAKSTFNNNEGTIITNQIECSNIKSITKNDDLSIAQVTCASYNKELMNSFFYCLTNSDILPITLINESLQNNFNILFIIKNTDLNKLHTIINNNFSNFTISTNKISRISIVGSGIINDINNLKNILKILHEYSDNIFNIEISTEKISITFNIVLSEEILNILHSTLILK